MRDGMQLGKIEFWLVTVFYLFLIIFFAISTYSLLLQVSEAEQVGLSNALQISVNTSLCFTPLFYIRKLYKDIFAGLSTSHNDEAGKRSATFVYYLTRPIFSTMISGLFIVIMYGAIRQFSDGHVGINSDFVIFASISSAVISIGTGSAINRIEEIARSGHSFFRLPM